MTVTWTSHISPDKWRRLRKELQANNLDLPFTGGVTHGKGKPPAYRILNRYYGDTSTLKLVITYPLDFGSLDGDVLSMLNRLFETEGVLTY